MRKPGNSKLAGTAPAGSVAAGRWIDGTGPCAAQVGAESRRRSPQRGQRTIFFYLSGNLSDAPGASSCPKYIESGWTADVSHVHGPGVVGQRGQMSALALLVGPRVLSPATRLDDQ